MSDLLNIGKLSIPNISVGRENVSEISLGRIKLWPNEIPSGFPEVTIGTQTWMAVNLDIDDGGGGISNSTEDYGRYYNLEAALRVANNIQGYHVPTIEEWDTLINYLGGYNAETARALKTIGTEYWNTANGTNSSGFSLKGSAYRCSINNIDNSVKDRTYMITSSPVDGQSYPRTHKILPVFDNNSISDIYTFSGCFHSVRLIKDNS